MRGASVLFLVLGLLAGAPASADQSAEAAAASLLDSMDMEAVLDTSIDAALDAQIAAKPELAPYKGVMHSFFAKYMSYESLKPQLVAAYASEFTASELAEAAAFYATPTGRKFLEKLPVLYRKGAEIGQAAVQGHVPELQEAIQAEAQRLQDLQRAETPGSQE